MNRIVLTIVTSCALSLLAACPAALAEDMPIVTDRPYTEEELAEIQAQEKDRLAQAQQMLIDLGYLTGKADGIMGPRTATAISDFQTGRGLEATGELNAQTMAALEEMTAAVADAREVQQRLIDLGYLGGTADGIFAERSREALGLFQRMHGLEATGVPDDATREKLFAEDAQALPGRLGRGDKGDGVEALQQRLIQFGFLNGKADGDYGKKTSAAVTRFQQHLLDQGIGADMGIEATGEATPMTQYLLMDPSYSSYLADIAPGYVGEEATRVERRLSQLGYMDAQADDTFDSYALQAANAFRMDAGLPLNDALGRADIDALFAEDAPEAEHFVLHDIAYGDKGLAVREVQEELVCGGMTLRMPNGTYNDSMRDAVGRAHDFLASVNSPQAKLFEDPGLLTIGAQQLLRDGLLGYTSEIGEADEMAIRRVQCRLHTLYYISKYGVDGHLGDKTREALSLFQENNGLAVTGNPDVATQRALFSKDAVCKKYPYRVEVDIDSQRVYIFELNDAGEYEQVRTFICSTGLGDATPRGIYLNGFPANRWHHFKEFNCWAQYSYEIEGNIMFHSVLYDEQDTSTLRYGSVYALGSKASHGCVRLQVEDAKWLFEHCKRGTLVIVIY